MTWITDKNGNRCSVERFGSQEAASRALSSLIGCSDCSDCSDCSRCSGCSDCAGCYDCSDCSDCSRCSRCSNCSRCYDCSGCYGCSGCSDNCSRCYDCYDCSGCYGCSGCSRCYDCSGCSGCSGCYRLEDAAPAKNDGALEKIVVPVIPDIHKAVYAAASQPNALRMNTWHTCEKTHCRAGWIVTLAGEAGRKLEEHFNTVLAAMKIYDASDPGFKINPCRFFDSNEDALADMKALAES